ncbi:uncharacterized protein LOC126374450 [Pectinophora gossypiella]|uniref:uncharacterized protein LOC126374450 n=1 Tax=Pectinophora gossypiella TaxID=13191 RepID=UPI00214E6C31|nr:uncharacterized protein LOC126374450 [Pectinophora gossypiella]
MKVVFLALFLAAATALPVPDDDGVAIDVIVNGVPEGEALEIADVLNIKLQEHVDGQLVSATDALYPFSAQGIAAAAAAAETVPETANPEIEKPELPEPVIVVDDTITPEDNEVVVIVNPETPEVVNPEEAQIQDELEAPAPIVLPEAPAAVVNPEPALPEEVPVPVVPEPEQAVESVPAPVQGEVFNDGLVQISVNQEPSVFGTLHSWFSLVINYIRTNGATETNQVV